jgi:hypothetical protein
MSKDAATVTNSSTSHRLSPVSSSVGLTRSAVNHNAARTNHHTPC